ncbi:MAG TPA: formate dehydrogenase accessory protein FdhE [Candidatus Deferrimicrobiaceae bacterium]|jgi:formate dehydrogenase maturation protein FdhE|nr:formate dehydrogenase accessory protein FdhE [Candidatus Deferrimicrobiaceae bacterium]
MKEAKWDRRIRRANELASSYSFSAEGLRYYARVATFQKNLYGEIEKALADSPKISSDRPLRDELDLFLLLPKFPGFLSVIQQIAPAPLAHAAAILAQKGPAGWQGAIEDFWCRDPELAAGVDDDDQVQSEDASAVTYPDRVLAWIFLQPYAECLADHREDAQLDGTPLTCPLCGGKPAVGVLRSEGDGAKKSLICMLCAHEWLFRRIYCPACAEEREPQMGFYSAPEIAHVRVDVCDTCHTYLKSIDLTKTGLAVPIVDELATMPLDLWALERGYEKLQINLLGT